MKVCCVLLFLVSVTNMTQDRMDVRENGKIKTKQLAHNFEETMERRRIEMVSDKNA